MPVLESTQGVPLSIEEDGTIRIADTRVGLESVVHHYEQGATAEEIALRFPALRLADIHACLAYYLNHKEKIHAYLSRQNGKAQKLQQRISSDPAQKASLSRMRQRIQGRTAKQRGAS